MVKVTVPIVGHIGYVESLGQGYTLEDLLNSVRGKSYDTLEIPLQSIGGQVIESKRISSWLASERARGVKYVSRPIGKVASAAIEIMVEADEVVADKEATFMIHKAHVKDFPISGNADTLKEMMHELASDLDEMDRSIISFYASKRKLKNSQELFQNYYKYESFMTADEALHFGLIDRIAPQQLNFYITDSTMAQDKEKLSAMQKMLDNFAVLLGIKDKAVNMQVGEGLYASAEVAAGVVLYSDEALTTPVADGSYTLASGVRVVVAAGVITEVLPAEELQSKLDAALAELAELKAQNTALSTEKTAAEQAKSAAENLAKEKESKLAEVTLAFGELNTSYKAIMNAEEKEPALVPAGGGEGEKLPTWKRHMQAAMMNAHIAKTPKS